MVKIKNKNKALSTKVLLLVAIFGLLLFNFKNYTAKGVSCSALTGDAAQQCKDLEQKAAEYKNLIDLKNQQQDTLQQQLTLIDEEQKRNQIEFQVTQNKAATLADQIDSLERQINDQERIIDYDKTILTGLMQSYYEDYQQGVLGIVLINKDFSDILNQNDYLEQSSIKVNDVISSITETKSKLETEQNDLAQKKAESDQLKSDLQDKTYYLQANEYQKQTLLTQTQGDEAKYQQLLARVEEQKLELFDFSSASNSGEVSASVDSYPKPDKKYATSWYFSQLDPRWANTTIGNSNSTMKSYGCAVASLSMVFRKYGSSIDPGKMAKQPIFYYDLIQWPGSWSPGITLTSSIGHGNVNWSTIDSEIANGHLVIVYIRKTNGKGGHYVVIYNKDSKDYIVNDPYFGANLYLNTSKALVGKIGADSGVTIDQMIIYK